MFLRSAANLIILVLMSGPAWAINRDVCATDCDYSTLADALLAANSGDTLRVAAGTFDEVLTIGKTNWSINVKGGYSSDFNAQSGTTNITGIHISYYNSGYVSIDKFSVNNPTGNGVYMSSPDTDVVLSNIISNNNGGGGIVSLGHKTLQITASEACNNGGYGGISAVPYYASGSISIADSIMCNNSCVGCMGLYISGAASSPLITGNIVYGNETGISLQSASSAIQPTVAFNITYGNSSHGIYLANGTASIHHNTVYNNLGGGLYYHSSGNSFILNNTFALNGKNGLHFVSGNSAPYIRNNIFSNNGERGVAFSGSSNGSGTSSVVPAQLFNNIFYANSLGHMLHMGQGPEFIFTSEIPAYWGDINRFAWSDANMILDPGLSDCSNGDCSLLANSFLIDEGYAPDEFSNEPLPNGDRINIGGDGNTSSTTTSPGSPSLSNLSAAQDGNDVVITFDTDTAVSAYWITVENWDGSNYQTISPGSLAGDSFVIGYRTGRITGASGQVLRWLDTGTRFAGEYLTSKIRITLEHGTRSASSETSNFTLNYLATPSPTSSPTPSATPSPSVAPTITATAMPSPTATELPATPPSATPTNKPKAAPVVTIHQPIINIGKRDNVRIPLAIEDPDSARVKIHWSLSEKGSVVAFGYKIIPKKHFPSSSLTVEGVSRKLTRGKYCLAAEDGDRLKSKKKCGKLIRR